MDEKRKQIRVFIPDGQVRLVTGPLLALVGKVENISLGGIRFTTETELKPGDQFEFQLYLPDGDKFSCEGKIIYVTESKEKMRKLICGVEFQNLTEDQKNRLAEFILKIK